MVDLVTADVIQATTAAITIKRKDRSPAPEPAPIIKRKTRATKKAIQPYLVAFLSILAII